MISLNSGAEKSIVICQNCQKMAWESEKKALSLQADKTEIPASAKKQTKR